MTTDAPEFVCEQCGKNKPDVQLRVDPYQDEINNEIVERWLCEDCYAEIAADI